MFQGDGVRIELRGTDFTRLVVDVADPDAVRAQLTRAAAARFTTRTADTAA
jgi:hypothetical protein